jgi:dTDP-glucose 4,6-dehydratase
MRILVTGGLGFIGSAVIRHLIAETDFNILNLDNMGYAANPDAVAACAGNPRYGFVQADVCDRARVSAVMAEFRPDAILHLAAETHVDRSIDRSDAFIATNVTGTHVLLESALAHWRTLPGEARERFRFHHVSTDEVFGSLGRDGLFTEESRYDPSSPYSASKAAADHLVRAWHRTYGLPVLLSNCSNNYGPFQFPEKLIPLMVIKALSEAPLPVYGRGAQIRDWLHVEDHARALRAILLRGEPGRSYNVGARSERTNLEVVESICALLDELHPRSSGRPYRDLIGFVADRPGHDFRYAIDPTRVETELGWSPRFTFAAGLRQTVEWYLHNKPIWQRVHNSVYAGERLGLSDDEKAGGVG